jgi:hypothetical protein
LHEVGGGVAVDVLEVGAVGLVFADEVVGAAYLDDAGSVGLDVGMGIGLEQSV